VSASVTPPWPGLGAYAVSKAALDKLVEAWRVEHPSIGFTRCIVGDCAGGEGDSASGFTDGWDLDQFTDFLSAWVARGLVTGTLIDVEHLVGAIDALLRSGASVTVPSVTITPRPPR
jgi:NAD(P)-dependent dehydrogenase (short-subunit alcohol dehydrogenase family)